MKKLHAVITYKGKCAINKVTFVMYSLIFDSITLIYGILIQFLYCKYNFRKSNMPKGWGGLLVMRVLTDFF